MKSIVSNILFCLISLTLSAQDVIVKTDQTEIKAKIEEITETTIKYKKFEMLDGPTYNINVKDVFMIIYKNGTKEYMKAADQQPVKVATIISQQSDKNTISEKPSHSPYSGGHPLLEREKSGVWYFEGKFAKPYRDLPKIYSQYGHDDLAKKIKTSQGVYFGMLGGGAVLGGIGLGYLITNIVVNDAFETEGGTMFPALLTGLGIGSLISATPYRNGVINGTAREFNFRSGNKVSQTIKISPAVGFDPAGKGGKIGVSIDF